LIRGGGENARSRGLARRWASPCPNAGERRRHRSERVRRVVCTGSSNRPRARVELQKLRPRADCSGRSLENLRSPAIGHGEHHAETRLRSTRRTCTTRARSGVITAIILILFIGGAHCSMGTWAVVNGVAKRSQKLRLRPIARRWRLGNLRGSATVDGSPIAQRRRCARGDGGSCTASRSRE